MLVGYVRPDARHPAGPHVRKLEEFGVKTEKIYIEEVRSRDDTYPERDAAVSGTRGKDQLVVTKFWQLASNRADLRQALAGILGAGKVIIEAETERRSDRPADLAGMILDTIDFYTGHSLTPKERRAIAKKGAAASPVTKPKRSRMPNADAAKIINGAPTIRMALALINSDKRYKAKWSQSHIYREAVAGRLKIDQRKSGPKQIEE